MYLHVAWCLHAIDGDNPSEESVSVLLHKRKTLFEHREYFTNTLSEVQKEGGYEYFKRRVLREYRFMREVTMLAKVQHKNLVKFIGACNEPMMVVVTELLLGGTQRKYMLSMGPRSLDPLVAVGFALDIARADGVLAFPWDHSPRSQT